MIKRFVDSQIKTNQNNNYKNEAHHILYCGIGCISQ